MPVKKVICSSVKYAFAFEVDSVSANDITLKSGYTLHTIKSNSAILAQDIKTGDQGPYYMQSLSVTSNDAAPSHDLIEQDLIFKLTTETGTVLILGSLDEPARCTGGDAELEGFKLKIERATVVALL